MKAKQTLGRITALILATALAAALSLTGCQEPENGGGTPPNFGTLTAFADWLAAQRANTAANPYTAKLNVSSTDDFDYIRTVLKANPLKYVYLDLSGSTVTTIPDHAFGGWDTFVGITIPKSVTSIEERAFSSCTGLASVTIPDSVTSIGSSAFSNCTSLASVTIPASVTSIEWYAFSGCTSLASVTIPNIRKIARFT